MENIKITHLYPVFLFFFCLCNLFENKDRNCRLILVHQEGTLVKPRKAALSFESRSPVKSLLLSLPERAVFLPPAQMYHTVFLLLLLLFCFNRNWCWRLWCLIGFMWVVKSPDQQPRSYLMLTKVVICTTSFGAEWGHPLCSWSHRQTNKQMRLGVYVGCVRGAVPLQDSHSDTPEKFFTSPSKSAQSQQKRGKENPQSPSGQRGKGWMD